MTIRLRLTLWFSGILAAALIVLCLAIYFFVNMNTYSDMKDQLREQALDYNVLKVEYGMNQMDLNIEKKSPFVDKDFYLQLVNYKDGIIKASGALQSNGIKYPIPEAKTDPDYGYVKANLKTKEGEVPFLIYQRPIYNNTANQELIGLLQVGTVIASEEKYLAGLRVILILSSMICLLLAFTIGLFLARKALQPIERVIRTTEQIQVGSDLSVRIPIEGPKDEIGRLVYTLNIMLSRIEMAYNGLDESYKAQRRFVSDASHELRTPLTTIRGNIELLQRMWSKTLDPDEAGDIVLAIDTQRWELSNEAMQDISAEARRMSTLVNDLLALARADAGYEMEKATLPMLPIVEEVGRRAGLLPRNAEWRIGDLSALAGYQVYGNADYLQQLLFIFIENAFKYTPSGWIEMSAVHKDNQLGIIIKDTGIGMNPEEVPHIFDRFYRADESRGKTVGTGLGLSIAKWIIDEHRGSIEVTTMEEEGSTFVIWLPIDFSPQPASIIMEGTDRNEA
ncbi:HAMP domain-containing histidine kinase [Paenibacillus glycanilyticus]|uniref:sensor histidine kinase n=1 Tax=Paenibacillus glycanilyticus TaxID=126569 RepID=UPI0020406972|nr:HAMP domain-containing sensor histidine kinase [Paenibacillus glycanilyticus]MCM3629212.1 HAMP domain-containing histidine kinase [Paenibacillus glycanilyticus]